MTKEPRKTTLDENEFAGWIHNTLIFPGRREVVVNSSLPYRTDGDTNGEFTAWFSEAQINRKSVGVGEYKTPIFHGHEDGNFDPGEYTQIHLESIARKVKSGFPRLTEKMEGDKLHFSLS